MEGPKKLTTAGSEELEAESNETDPVAWVRERTIPTERPPFVSQVSVNFCG
jgi:hypothetical protein